MTSAVQAVPDRDHTELRHLLTSAAMLGVFQSILVVAFAVVSRSLAGPAKVLLEALIVIVGVGTTISLPGLRTRALTIEGIAGAAAIGLAAAGVFLVIDVALLQPLRIYTNRWLEIGGGSNWWYHPVWWMVGTYLAWMGGWILANQTTRSGSPNAGLLIGGTMALAAAIMVVAKLAGFPGAHFGVGTFAVAILPALAILVIVTGLGARRR